MKSANHPFRHALALLALAIVNAQLSTGFAQLTFTTNTYGVGGSSTSIAAADVNGDGKLDLVAANGNTNTLTVLTNDGSGIFGSNATQHVGNGPACVVAADVNGDGSLDLITANNDSTLTVLTNNGNGAFGSNATLNVGVGPHCVAAADINGDGKPDLISANAGIQGNGSTLTVLTNNGSGTFGSNATLNVGMPGGRYGPWCVVTVDVNGDGKLDLVSANALENSLSVLTNSGTGVFGLNTTLSVGFEPMCVVAADLNGDGKPDLISANAVSWTLTVLTNNGSGRFGLKATLAIGSQPYWVVAADINGDGKLDLISANALDHFSARDHTLSVLTNNGSGVFGSNATLNVGSTPQCVAAADVNGDGKLDLISANTYDKTLTVLINTTAFPSPSLHVASTGDQVALSWPTWCGNYVLESATDLSAPDWEAVTDGTPLTNSAPARFFRLHQF